MSSRHAPETCPVRGTALPPSSGPEADWAHPLLGRMLRLQRLHRRLDRIHPWVHDAVLILIVFALSIPDVLTHSTHGPFGQPGNPHHLSSWILFAFAVSLIAPLWWRRKAPAAAFFAIALVSLGQWSAGVWQFAGLSALIALYNLARYGSLRALGQASGVTVILLVLATFVLTPGAHPLLTSFFMLGTAAAAVAAGLTLRTRTMYLTALEDRAARLEIERDQRVQLTAAAERSRVAREMHDIVGHNLSVMVSLADGAATLAANNHEKSAEALRILGDTGRQAMGELRRVLGVLGESGRDTRLLSPQPAIRDLDPLLTRVRAAGITATYRTQGDIDALGEGVQLTVYRIVQEALTNTLKHAGAGAAAEVTVTADVDMVRVRVADDGGSPDAPTRGAAQQAVDDPGHGLVGIRQRAAMYHGTVTIGPREPGPGWVVDVRLETRSSPTPPMKVEHPS